MTNSNHEQREEKEEILVLEVVRFIVENSSLYQSGRELPGPKTLADGRKIKVEYSQDEADFDTSKDTIDLKDIRPLAERLIREGTAFTVTSGHSDETLQVKFSLEETEQVK